MVKQCQIDNLFYTDIIYSIEQFKIVINLRKKTMRDFHYPGRSPVFSQNGMVATSHPIASKVALETLERGGNAVDAAVAAALVLPICEPQMTGLYGDMFALIKPAGSEKIIGLNSSGKSPKHLDPEMLRSQGLTKIPSNSVHSITLPGAIDGFEKLTADYGKIGLAATCESAIYYAENGVPVAPRVAFDWEQSVDNLSKASCHHYLVNGKTPKSGDVFKAPLQADVLRKIAKLGTKGFYEGEVAEDIIQSLRRMGGVHTMDDMADVSSEYVNPISAFYRDVELIELPPNGQGATALLLGNILSNFELSSMDPFSYQRAHLEAEASKLAYHARNQFIADSNFLKPSFNEFLDSNFSSKLANSINPRKASPNLKSPTEEVHLDTVLVTVVDKNRCSVSLIFSIFHSFGSGHSSEKFGLLFQNRGAGFTLEKNHPNELSGNKRPMHTIIPAMVKKDGRLMLVYGVMGGQYQPAGHIRVLSNLIDYGLDLQEAIDKPRSFSDSTGLILENGYSSKVADTLQKMGHNIIRPKAPLGGAQGILINNKNGVLTGGSDPRKDGLAIGY
jgi:gamma-glutamyltranspeptidase/glutathione hydrolase